MACAITDRLYASLCNNLPESLRAVAFELPFRLKLAPAPDVPWSRVFKHELTLGAPEVLWAATPGFDAALLEAAVLAHMLAVIEAFGTDRVEDGQVAADADLLAVLEQLRSARDRAFHALGGDVAVDLVQRAGRTTLCAIARERTLLAAAAPVGFDVYRSVSAEKQAIGLAASLAFGIASGLSSQRLDLIGELLLGVCLGLQHYDDVLDWEDDAERGGAWAIRLSSCERNRQTGRDALLASRVLGHMLGFAVEAYSRAQSAGEQLGMSAMSAWLGARTLEARELRDGEMQYPGYVGRRLKLAPWALQVLARGS
jgi:hypothetical protein